MKEKQINYEELRETIIEVLEFKPKKVNVDNYFIREHLSFHTSRIVIKQNNIYWAVCVPLPICNSNWTNSAFELYFVLEDKFNAHIDWSMSKTGNEYKIHKDVGDNTPENYLVIYIPKKMKIPQIDIDIDKYFKNVKRGANYTSKYL